MPEHLKMGFQVRNTRNKILGEGKDLRALQQQLHKEIRSALADSLGASDDTMAKMVALAQGGSGGSGNSGNSGSSAASAKKSAKNAQNGTAQVADAHGSQVREISGLTEFPADLFLNGEIPARYSASSPPRQSTATPPLSTKKPA